MRYYIERQRYDLLVRVTLDAGDGQCDIKSITCLVGGQVPELPVPTHETLSFVGWYKDEEGTQRVSEGDEYDGFKKLYAKYIEHFTYDGLCFTAESDGATISLNNVIGEYQYSKNGNGWIDYVLGTTLSFDKDEFIYFKAKTQNETCNNSSSTSSKFVMSGKIAASGNIQSLLDETLTRMDVPTYCYSNMFSNCTSLTQAPELPATTLANSCYSYMFSYCTSLTQAPALLATTVTYSCYSGMFSNCTSLTQAPELPATTLANYCYYNMFYRCTSLTQAPELPATTLADNCYSNMFSNCTSLTQAPELPAETLASNCYQSMFSNCKSLTQAPALPATTLANYCYNSMFGSCSNLQEIHVGFTEWHTNATYSWMNGVNGEGTFYCSSQLPVENGDSRIPTNFTVVTTD